MARSTSWKASPTRFADLSAALGDGMYVSDALAPDRLAHLWVPHTERLTAD